MTKVVLATAHRDHDTGSNTDANLAAFCQRCHCCTTGPSIGADAGLRCSGDGHWATCFGDRAPKLIAQALLVSIIALTRPGWLHNAQSAKPLVDWMLRNQTRPLEHDG